MTSLPRVSGLFVHPVKSAAAIAVDTLALDDRGAIGDRRWLVVHPDGRQITARDTPALALVRPSFADGPPVGASRSSPHNLDGALRLEANDLPPIHVNLPGMSSMQSVQVWDDVVPAYDAGDTVAEWLSTAINTRCRLVRLADESHRPLAARYAGPVSHVGRRVAFSDGAPLLILGQASVDALSERIVEQGGEAMVVARFRPNIVVSHTAPHAEDQWRLIHIGDVPFGLGNACIRCVMTTIDPATGIKGLEPLRTLATYRRQDGQVIFGMNATHGHPGVIRSGDVVQVL